jgi:hypothetical protein
MSGFLSWRIAAGATVPKRNSTADTLWSNTFVNDASKLHLRNQGLGLKRGVIITQVLLRFRRFFAVHLNNTSISSIRLQSTGF